MSFKGAVEGGPKESHFQFWSQKFRLFCFILLIHCTVSSVHFNEIVRLKNIYFHFFLMCMYVHILMSASA